MKNSRQADLTLVGGGIVGLATAYSLLQSHPNCRLILLEKEANLGTHQTGHSSGVIHSGLFYPPGSLKARLTTEGGSKLIHFCEENGIPVHRRGKLVIATSPEEIPLLDRLFDQANQKTLKNIRRLGPEGIREIEPCAAGLQALHLPEVATVDFAHVARSLGEKIKASGAHVHLSTQLKKIQRCSTGWRLVTTQGIFLSRNLITCSGLYADHVARMTEGKLSYQIVPFRGEYRKLTPEYSRRIRGLIYPVPKPELPFLGIHLTRTSTGQVLVGPNAILALRREGYRWFDLHPGELSQMLAYAGFWRMGRRYWKTAIHEWARSVNPRIFLREVQKLVPAIQAKDLIPSAAGVRAQAVFGSGELMQDFQLQAAPGRVHLGNAPSPAATAALAIGDHLAQTAEHHLQF